MINVTRSSMPSYEEYCEEIKELWDSRWLTNNGAKHKQLEADLKRYLNTPNITLFTNGHLALEIAISAMDFHALDRYTDKIRKDIAKRLQKK